MLRDSFTDAQKPQVTRRRSLAVLLVAGACCLALGLIGFESSQVRQPIADETMYAIDKPLIGLNKEEEVVQLDAEDAALSKNFYSIVDECSNWFAQASKQLAARQNGFLASSIDGQLADKKRLLLNAREEYAAVKNQLFDVLDSIRDAQLNIESAEKRIHRYMSKMGKYLKKPQWKWQSRISVKVTRSCNKDQEAVTALIKKIDQQYADLAKLMSVMVRKDEKIRRRVAPLDCSKYATAEAPVDSTPTTPTTPNNASVPKLVADGKFCSNLKWFVSGVTEKNKPEACMVKMKADIACNGSFFSYAPSNGFCGCCLNNGDSLTKTTAQHGYNIYSTTTPTTTTETDAEGPGEEREALRKQKLARCHRAKAARKAGETSVSNRIRRVTRKWKQTKSITVETFPASLITKMQEYEEDAKVAKEAGRDMVGTEQADAKAENAHAQKVSQSFLDDAIAAGKQNVALKNKMIQ